MDKNTFILMAMKTQDDFLGRYLDMSQDEVETQPDNATVMEMLSEVYDQMPKEDQMKFENELTLLHDYIEIG